MAVTQRQQVVPMTLWELFYACRRGNKAIQSGVLHVWAPDGETAIETVRRNPSQFGLTEHPIVGHATGLRLEGSLNGRSA